jgi:hypothetical protein
MDDKRSLDSQHGLDLFGYNRGDQKNEIYLGSKVPFLLKKMTQMPLSEDTILFLDHLSHKPPLVTLKAEEINT